MAHCYKFAIVRLAPDETRDERINIGAVVMSETGLDVRISRRLERARALSAALDVGMLRDLIENLRGLDARLRDAGTDEAGRFEMLSRIGPLTLSASGSFSAEDHAAYESRVESIFKAMVDPEPQLPRFREKRSKLLTQVKSVFKQERVLAKKDEKLDSHRIVSGFELDEGLVADFVLRNGALHVIETVDASGDEDTLRKAISEIAVAALILERARMKFGENETKARVVYSASSGLEKVAMPSLEAAKHQGAEITNWASAEDRLRFVHSLTSLATPLPRPRRGSVSRFAAPEPEKFRFQ
jgi:hypothetical protein